MHKSNDDDDDKEEANQPKCWRLMNWHRLNCCRLKEVAIHFLSFEAFPFGSVTRSCRWPFKWQIDFHTCWWRAAEKERKRKRILCQTTASHVSTNLSSSSLPSFKWLLERIFARGRKRKCQKDFDVIFFLFTFANVCSAITIERVARKKRCQIERWKDNDDDDD